MADHLEYLLQIIRVDFFFAFALYSILYVVVPLFSKNPGIEAIDVAACRLVRWIGILYLLVFTALLLFSLNSGTEDERAAFLLRATGPYAFAYWMMPVPWLVITQLLRFDKVRKFKLLRLFFSVCLMVSFEQFVIIMTSFHRDYLPSSWRMHYTVADLIVGILLKITAWVVLTMLFLWSYRKVTALRNQN